MESEPHDSRPKIDALTSALPLGYAKPDLAADVRDDAAGVLIREAADGSLSWAVHALVAAFFFLFPASMAWRGFSGLQPPVTGILERTYAVLVAAACAVLGLYALARPLNWREVFIDVENGRIDERWRRWGRRGARVFDLATCVRLALHNDDESRTLRIVRRGDQTPRRVTVARFKTKEEFEALANRIADRTGLPVVRERW